MTAADEIVISEAGGSNPRRVPVVGVSCSTEISNIGSLSCFARIDDLRAVGLAGELKGKWLEWSHPTVGRWAGVIGGRPLSDDIAEIFAEGWASLLGGRSLLHWDQPPPGSPAGIARRAIGEAVSPEHVPSFITIGTIDESGPPIGFTLGGQDLLNDVLPQLSDDGGLEWIVDADRVFHAGTRLGVDRSASVRLHQGREILEPKFADDRYTVIPTETFTIESRQAQARRGGPGAPGGSTAPSRRRWKEPRIDVVRETITVERPQSTPLEMTLADVDGCWARCGLGDTVRVIIESAGFAGTFRVLVRDYDSASNTLGVAGEATPDASAA